MIAILKNRSVLLNNALSLTFMQIFNFLPFLVIPFLTRKLGIDVYGEVMSILIVSTFSYVFVDYGFNISATYKIAKNKNDLNCLSIISSNVMAIRIIISLLLLCVYLLDYFFFFIFFSKLSVVFLVFGTVFFQSLISDWFFQGIEKMFNMACYTVLIRVFYAFSVIFFIEGPEEADYVIVFWMISNAAGALFSLILMKKNGIFYSQINIRDLFSEVKEGWLFFKARAAVSLYTSLNGVLLGIVNPIYLAYYSVGDQAYKASQSVTSPVNRALYPYMIRTRNWPLFFNIFFSLISVIIVSEIIMIYYASHIVLFVFGSGFDEAVLSFRVFMVTVAVTYVGLTFGNPVFGALNKLEIPNKISVYAGFFHLCGFFALYFFYEINHLSIAVLLLLTESLVAGLRVYFFIRCYNV